MQIQSPFFATLHALECLIFRSINAFNVQGDLLYDPFVQKLLFLMRLRRLVAIKGVI